MTSAFTMEKRGGDTMAKTKKARVGVAVTGRSVAYIQTVGKGGKLGKAQPVVVT